MSFGSGSDVDLGSGATGPCAAAAVTEGCRSGLERLGCAFDRAMVRRVMGPCLSLGGRHKKAGPPALWFSLAARPALRPKSF